MKYFFTKKICIALVTILCAWNLNAQNYNVVLSANPAVGGVVIGGGVFEYGMQVTVSAIPQPFFVFERWEEDGEAVTFLPKYQFVVTKERHLVAIFSSGEREIKLSANPQEWGAVSGGGVYTIGEIVTVTAEAYPDFQFINWKEEDKIVSTDDRYSFPILASRNLTANFIPSTIKISLSQNIKNGGTVSGGGIYQYGQTVIVEADMNLPQFMFTNWTEDGNTVSTNFIYAFNANQNRHLVANFMPAIYEIPVYASPNQGGKVSGAGVYSYGDRITITAEANPGYLFSDWKKYYNGNPIEVYPNPMNTFEIIGNYAYVAFFKAAEGKELSAKSIDTESILIYPNPTTGELIIESRTLKVDVLEVFDMSGKQILNFTPKTPNLISINISDFPAGIYLLKFQTEQGIITKRFVKD